MNQIKLPVVGRVDSKSMLVGVGAMTLLMVLPKVSDFIVPIITDIRDKIGGNK
jgi:hypothetical protein